MVVITMLLGRVRDSVSVGASSTFSAAGPSITIPLGSPRPPPPPPSPVLLLPHIHVQLGQSKNFRRERRVTFSPVISI